MSSSSKKTKKKIVCGAVKANGTGTCKKPVSKAGKKCHHHDPQKKPYSNHGFDKAGPIIAMPTGLSSSSAMALRTKVNTAATSVKTDRPGWIYVYWLKDDADTTYFKIGCTSLMSAQSRVSQWPGAIMRYGVKVKCNQLCERLIHAMLDDKRLLRYVYKDTATTGGVGGSGKHFLTVHRDTKELIQDAAWDNVCKIAAALGPAEKGEDGKEARLHPVYPNKLLEQAKASVAPTFGTRTKEVEWFKAKFSVIKKTVDLVAKAVSAWAT